jgi:hypothetical protein
MTEVAEPLPSKRKALSLNPVPPKKKKKHSLHGHLCDRASDKPRSADLGALVLAFQ